MVFWTVWKRSHPREMSTVQALPDTKEVSSSDQALSDNLKKEPS